MTTTATLLSITTIPVMAPQRPQLQHVRHQTPALHWGDDAQRELCRGTDSRLLLKYAGIDVWAVCNQRACGCLRMIYDVIIGDM